MGKKKKAQIAILRELKATVKVLPTKNLTNIDEISRTDVLELFDKFISDLSVSVKS